MVKSKKSNRVSWPPDVKLCQVRLFLSEDSPSQVGLGAQDHLQAKASWLLHSTGAASDDQLPPGFEGALSSNHSKIELSQIPLIKWRSPPRFVFVPDWQVVAGDESKEAEIQKQREMRVLEAVYPRPSSIPPSPHSPSGPPEAEASQLDERNIPAIPITPIEDEDVSDSSSSLMMPINAPTSSQLPAIPQSFSGPGVFQTSQGSSVRCIPESLATQKPVVGNVPGVQPDVVAAASAAFTAIMRSNEQGSLVDPELLIKILNNPKLIENLVADYANPTNPQTGPKPRSPPITSAPKPRSPPVTSVVPQSSPSPVQINSVLANSHMSAAPNTGHFHPVTNAVAPTLHPPPPRFSQVSAPNVKPPPVKDINYYKSLIQQHGGEKQDAKDQTHPVPQFGNHHNYNPSGLKLELLKSRDTKPKINKPCIYFNSSRGCKHGANCVYQHDASVQQRMGSMPEAQSAKRIKIDREITGRS